MVNTGVFERGGAGTMSRNAFYLAICGILTWGFVLSGFLAEQAATWQPGWLELLFFALVLPFGGIALSMWSNNALVSFVGFNMVAGGFGLLLGPVLAAYNVAEPGLVTEAARLTGIVTGVMAVSGLMFPGFYSRIGGALFMGLLCAVGVSFLTLFIPGLFEITLIHVAVAGLFALYIGYDMHRASQIPATLDNAVDVAVSLYLDIVNLFLRVLTILAQSRR